MAKSLEHSMNFIKAVQDRNGHNREPSYGVEDELCEYYCLGMHKKIRMVQGIASTIWPAYPIVFHYGRFKAQATFPDAVNSRGTLDCILGCTMFSANCIHVGDCWNIL
jgi:hypothetical protein